jgi:hypothetical protein
MVQPDARADSPSSVRTWDLRLLPQYDDVGPRSVVHVSEEAGIDLKPLSLFDQAGAFRRCPTQLATLTARENCLKTSFWVTPMQLPTLITAPNKPHDAAKLVVVGFRNCHEARG